MLKKFFLFLLLIILLFGGLLLFNTLMFSSKQITVEPVEGISVPDSAIHRFAHSITFKTISKTDQGPDSAAFEGYHSFLKDSYPLIDSLLTLEKIGGYSLLYTWKGKDESLEPIILMSHQDVVPPDEKTLDQWEGAPFAGTIRTTFYMAGEPWMIK